MYKQNNYFNGWFTSYSIRLTRVMYYRYHYIHTGI